MLPDISKFANLGCIKKKKSEDQIKYNCEPNPEA